MVTDGQVGNEDQVLNELASRLKWIRVFTLGIDQAVNEGFLRRLTDLGQGGGGMRAGRIGNRLDAVMASIHRRIGTPVVTDLCLEPSDGRALDVAGRYAGALSTAESFHRLAALADGPIPRPATGEIAVRGKTLDGGDWRVAVVPSVRDNPAVAAAWACGQVRHSRTATPSGGAICRPSSERSSQRRSLRRLCRFTAYLAIDRAAVVNEGGEVHQITQPVEMPAGWGEVALEAAACYAAPTAMKEPKTMF